MIQGSKSDRYQHAIIDALSGLDIRKIILFGSYVKGYVTDESDIDLLIVLDDNTLPKTYDEWLEIKMKVRRALRDINNLIAIDLLVYTKPQYDQILHNMNSFQKEIHETGQVLYEKAS